jgi:hypothetical protein
LAEQPYEDWLYNPQSSEIDTDKLENWLAVGFEGEASI